jgi:signal transduction histidine kinase
MLACNLEKKEKFDLNFAANAADAQMVSRMRVVLAVSVLLAVFIDPTGLRSANTFTWIVLFGYLAHSSAVYGFVLSNNVMSQSHIVHRLDVFWFAMIIWFTGGVNSFFFLFFFFAIMVASFRWGLEEGARVTLASAALFAISGLMLDAGHELTSLLLRITFLLVLGYMCANWGESKVRLMRQLALLRDVSHLSNPRFGVDHTLTSILEKTCTFFEASSCILIMQDRESGESFLRTFKEFDEAPVLHAERVDEKVAGPLLVFGQDQVMFYNCPPWPVMAHLFEEAQMCDSEGKNWVDEMDASARRLAEMLEAQSFISAPVLLRRQQGRIYVISSSNSFDKADALFLSHMAEHAFPVIENIELLDKMASEAASQERKKMSLNLHDTAIQPYIGLKLGLSALRHKAAADNPLRGDLDKLISMAEKVICDLRHYAKTLRTGPRLQEPVFLTVLRQQAAQMQEFYGINIDISMASEMPVSDRLSTEVVQMVREGLSNICKHTLAQRGFIKIDCANGWLKIQIENESVGSGREFADFMPRSLSERAAGLGGKVHVRQIPQGNTVVHVEIPV